MNNKDLLKNWTWLHVILVTLICLQFSSCDWETYDPNRYSQQEPSTDDKEKPTEERVTYYLSVTAPPTIPLSGGNVEFTVTSYKKDGKGNNVPVPWVMRYASSDGWTESSPSWLTIAVDSQQGSDSPVTLTATAAKREITVSAVKDYDLSTEGGMKVRNTANCYPINTPGSYRLPLVYGNAIKDGKDNTVAYKPAGVSGDGFLTPFVNHNGNGIVSPWLKDNNVHADRAQLVWQDGNNLLTDVSLDGDYITFTVPEGATEGNAMIAAMVNDEIAWSWHIWLTTEMTDSPATVSSSGVSYKVAPVNLGYATDGQPLGGGSVASLVSQIRIEQVEEKGLSRDIMVSQAGGKISAGNSGGYQYCTYYQWGRKDPELPAAESGRATRPAYSHLGMLFPQMCSYAVDIATTIKYPYIHFANVSNRGPFGPFGSGQLNLWNATATDNKTGASRTVKTIYDPCPPGYCVPPVGFLNLLINGKKYHVEDGVGLIWQDGKESFCLPRMGFREHLDAGIWQFGDNGWYWLSTPEKDSHAPEMSFSKGALIRGSSPRAKGFTIRPILED